MGKHASQVWHKSWGHGTIGFGMESGIWNYRMIDSNGDGMKNKVLVFIIDRLKYSLDVQQHVVIMNFLNFQRLI